MEDGLDVSAAPRPFPTEIEASFVVLGPRNEGSNYGIITHSPNLSIDNATRQLLEDYALMTLAAGFTKISETVFESARAFLEAECAEDEITIVTDQEHGDIAIKSEWTTDGQTVYRPVLLSHGGNGTIVVTGLALLLIEPGKPYRNPSALASKLSKHLINRDTTR